MTTSHRPHHRFNLSKLTGFRRPNQTTQTPNNTTHQEQNQPEEPSEGFINPHHYHSHRPSTSTANPNMSTATAARPQPRVHFAGAPTTTTYTPQHRSRSGSHSSSSAPSSLHSAPVSTASSRSSFDLEPTTPVAMWCHQMHIMQGRGYDWCQGCFPREKVAEQQEADDEEEARIEEKEQYRYTEEELAIERRAKMVERAREGRGAGHAYQ